MIRKAMVLAALGALTSACVDTTLPGDDTADSGGQVWFDEDATVNDVGAASVDSNGNFHFCQDGSPDTWTFDFDVRGTTGSVELDMCEFNNTVSNAWCESHAFTANQSNVTNIWDEDDDDNDGVFGEWDYWIVTLDSINSDKGIGDSGISLAYTSGTSTVFSCAWDDGTTMSYKATLVDANQETDCVVWGFNPDHMFPGHDCETITPKVVAR